jgi:hypothetical protein
MTIVQAHPFQRRLKLALGALTMAGGTAAVVLAGVPALASPHAASPHPASAKTRTGPEVISGSVTGKRANANTPHIPLRLRGVVGARDAGFVLGNGHGNSHTLLTSAGKLAVRGIGQQQVSQKANFKTCHATYTVRQTFKVVGSKSTGAFAGASGPGAYQIYFAAFYPRYTSGKHKGQCNTSNNARPLNRGAVASFLASAVLTVR